MIVIFFWLLIPVLCIFMGWEVDRDILDVSHGYLIAISAANFTIMSIWIAFLYPNAIERLRAPNIINADFSENGVDTEKVRLIISIIIQSVLVMAMVIAMIFVDSFSKVVSFSVSSILSKAVVFFTMVAIAVQLTALFSVIQINMSFVSDLERKNKKRISESDV